MGGGGGSLAVYAILFKPFPKKLMFEVDIINVTEHRTRVTEWLPLMLGLTVSVWNVNFKTPTFIAVTFTVKKVQFHSQHGDSSQYKMCINIDICVCVNSDIWNYKVAESWLINLVFHT